jgi:hypothetical protein
MTWLQVFGEKRAVAPGLDMHLGKTARFGPNRVDLLKAGQAARTAIETAPFSRTQSTGSSMLRGLYGR